MDRSGPLSAADAAHQPAVTRPDAAAPDDAGPFPPGPGPQLLVSVRNVSEARAAVSGGCTILDVKEPAAGSLGMAPPAEISQIAAWLTGEGEQHRSAPPLSVALGELRDWQSRSEVPRLPSGVRFAKLGLAGCRSNPDWQGRWHRLREAITACSDADPAWVAVSYADWPACDAPPPDEVLSAAIDSGCEVFLLDTFHKNGKSVFDGMPVVQVRRLLERIHSAGLRSALAGGLQIPLLNGLQDCLPDVIAVRAAACRDGHREAAICRDRVQQLCHTIAQLRETGFDRS